MKKLILSIMIVGTINACSTKMDYVVDPRVGKNPQEIIRDKLECNELVKHIMATKYEKIWGVIPICTSITCMKFNDSKYDPMKTCLTNRGHSILN